MKRFMSFFCITLLALTSQVRAQDNCDTSCVETTSVASAVRSIIIPRNQGANTARELVGTQPFIHLCDVCETYGMMGVEFEYQRSFRPARIANQLFGPGSTSNGTTSDGCTTSCSDDTYLLRFQGSEVADRESTSLIADNFGLSQDFDGTLKMKPVIDNFIVDIEFYLGLDCWVPNLWFRSNLPITHTRWSLFDTNNNCDNGSNEIINNGSLNTAFPACYMDETQATAASSIEEALGGNFLFGDMQTAWTHGKFSTKRLDVTRLADIDLILGYDFLCDDCSHFGLYLQASAPTGNTPTGVNIFEPIAGNGHHWGLGGGITAHSTIWESDCDQNLAIWFVGNVQHLFSDTQTRSFDFKDQGAMSRYQLLKEFSTDGVYTGKTINAINFATRTIESKFKIMGDASLKFAYNNCGFSTDIGYNVWGRDAEEIKLCKNSNDLQDGIYGFKGCEGVCALNYTTDQSNPNLITGPADPATQVLNSTQSTATAYTCPAPVNNVSTVDNPAAITPPPVEGTPATLTWNSVQAVGTGVGPAIGDITEGVIFAANSDPISTVSVSDLNFLGARSSLTHKIFGYVGYTWYECDFTPFVGIHGEVEFDGRRNSDDDCPSPTTTSTTDNSTTNRKGDRSINQWGIGIKGGMSF